MRAWYVGASFLASEVSQYVMVPETEAGSFALPLSLLLSLSLLPPQAVTPRTMAAAIATADMPRRIPDSLMRVVPDRPDPSEPAPVLGPALSARAGRDVNRAATRCESLCKKLSA